MSIEISSTEAARHLGDCLARIKHVGETFILTRNDKPVARLGPLSAPRTAPLKKICKALREIPSDPGFADDLARVWRAGRPFR